MRSVEPFGDVDDADAFHLTLGVLRAGDDHFRIGVLDGEQGGDFPLQRFGAGNIVTYLDIGLYAFFDGDEIDFFFAELPDVDFVSAAQQFDGDEIFIEMPVIGVSTLPSTLYMPLICLQSSLTVFILKHPPRNLYVRILISIKANNNSSLG